MDGKTRTVKILDGAGRERGELRDAPSDRTVVMNRHERRAAAVKLRRAAKQRKAA